MNWLLVLAALAGLGYGVLFEGAGQSALRAFAKSVPVSLLALAAILLAAPWSLVVALVFSAAGDWLLAHAGKPMFLAGLFAFLVAHLAYCRLFLGGLEQEWVAGPAFAIGLSVIVVLVAATYWRLRPNLGDMTVPVALYCTVIAAMLTTALARGPDLPLLAGAALFAASDLVLGFETFVMAADSPVRRWSGPFTWFAYFAGQWLIAAALLGLLRL